MIFNLQNEYDYIECVRYFHFLIGRKKIVTISEQKAQRSLSQNRYLHLILSWFACEYGCSLDEVKIDFFKRGVNPQTFCRKKVNKQGIEVEYLKSTRELDTSEMTLCIERFRNYASTKAGIYLPDANDRNMLFFIEKEIKKNEEYL